jgi:hypothetical protein
MKCPNVSNPWWSELVNKIGLTEAYREFLIKGDIPDPSRYRQGKLASDFSDSGKIKNINFEVDERTRQTYNRTAGGVLSELSKDSKFLLLSGTSGNTRIALPEDERERNQAITERFSGSPDSSRLEEVLGRTLEELYNSPDRDQFESRFAIGCFIASRLTEQGDNFVGRLAAALEQRGMVGRNYIRIENAHNKPGVYVTERNLFINIHQIFMPSLYRFESAEDFIKGVEIILSEELIHLAALSLVTSEEMDQIYKELSRDEIRYIKSIYRSHNDNPETIVDEYIRMMIQQDIFGTFTENELRAGTKDRKPTSSRTFLGKLMKFLVDVFKSKPDRLAARVIDRIKTLTEEGTTTPDEARPGTLYYQSEDSPTFTFTTNNPLNNTCA